MKIKYLFFALCVLGHSIKALSQTTLTTGDIAFIGIQSGFVATPTPKDRFAFVLLKDVDANTEILLSDNAVKSVSPIRMCNNESTITWRTEASLSAGTVVVITESDTNASVGKVKGSIALSQSGDAILAYQVAGSDTIPLAGIGNVDWLATCLGTTGTCGGANNNATCLPAPLDASTALNLSTGLNNSFLNTLVLTGTPEEIRAQINNPANWTSSDEQQTWASNTWTFSVTVSNKTSIKRQLFQVVPNPASETLKISGGEFTSVQVCDVLGKRVLTKDRTIGNELDLRSLRDGLYFISILGADHKVIQISRIVKK